MNIFNAADLYVYFKTVKIIIFMLCIFYHTHRKKKYEEDIRSSVLDMLSLRCVLDRQ